MQRTKYLHLMHHFEPHHVFMLSQISVDHNREQEKQENRLKIEKRYQNLRQGLLLVVDSF